MNNIINDKYINIEYLYPYVIYLNNKIQNLTNRSRINITKQKVLLN